MAQEYGYGLKIPKERIAVFIGKDGEVKKKLQEETDTSIDVDSKEGEIFIKGEDALNLFNAREVVKAIGRGFNPDIAFLLLKGDYSFEIINLSDYARNKNDLLRIKGRVIGRSGKSRATIEELTETYISVYGKTISIIGLPDNVSSARKALENLVKGSSHANVYKSLERKRKEMKQKDFIE